MVRITLDKPYIPIQPIGLELIYDDILNVEVTDPSDVSEWNAFFQLPTYGGVFTSVVVDGNKVTLIGGTGITLRNALFYTSYLTSIHDNSLSITYLDVDCLKQNYTLTSVKLNGVLKVENGAFALNTALTLLELASCADIGDTTGNDYVFNESTGNTLTLKIPIAIMTCNGGNPDGDIQYLQANNTVTIITV